jgi:uncharacterized repeat protein (TIGR01451 family)
MRHRSFINLSVLIFTLAQIANPLAMPLAVRAASAATVGNSAYSSILPSWFNPAPVARTARNTPHHTILPTALTVTGPSAPINNCDVVTFTIVAVNDTVTTTNVIITSTMPAGFEPDASASLTWAPYGPGEVITRYAVFSATCSAVSGQNVVTLTQDGAPPIVRYTDFVVNPGAITVRKEPAVIKAAPDEVVTWTVYIENTGYGNVSNVRVTDTLGSGLEYVGGVTSTSYVSLAVGQVVTFPIAARVVGCSGLENVVTATWGCNGQTCLAPQTAKGAVDLAMINPDLDFSLPSFDVPYCTGSGVFTIPITNTWRRHRLLRHAGGEPLTFQRGRYAARFLLRWGISPAAHPARPDLQPCLHPDPPLRSLHDAPQRHLQL